VDAEYAGAVQAFGGIENTYPGSDLYPDAVFKLGTAYYMLEAYDSSAFYFDMAAKAGKASLVEDAYFNLGLALEETGSLEEASEAFRSLALRFPFSERFERALMRAGYTLQQAGRPLEAVSLYEALLRYAGDTETSAEALYWIGESFAETGRPLRAACEFLRLVHLFPDGGPWTGTAAFRAGLECEKAGLPGHAIIVYRENVAKFGTGSDWGRASAERLEELEGPGDEIPGDGEASPDDTTGGSEAGDG
jgi:TolA-binding protein